MFDIISYDFETLVLDDRLAREKIVCGSLCVGDRLVDEVEKTSPAVARAVSAHSGVFGEVREG